MIKLAINLRTDDLGNIAVDTVARSLVAAALRISETKSLADHVIYNEAGEKVGSFEVEFVK